MIDPGALRPAQRGQQDALSVPSFGVALPERADWQGEALSPCNQTQRFSRIHQHRIDRHHPSLSPVLRLPLLGGPSAIFGAVRAVVVDAVERVVKGRPRSHVGVEPTEVTPLRADGDAASTVVGIGVVARSQASGSHAGPTRVFGRPMHSVLTRGLPQDLLLPASARHRQSAPEIPAGYRARRSAVAATAPMNTTSGSSIGVLAEDRQATEPGTGQHGNLWGHHDLPTRHRGVTGPRVRSAAAPSCCSDYTRPSQVRLLIRERIAGPRGPTGPTMGGPAEGGAP